MNKGDIVLYKHREGMEYYGIIERDLPRDRFSVDVLTDASRHNWATGFVCTIDKLEVVEAYETL